jgi:hypothetical protein
MGSSLFAATTTTALERAPVVNHLHATIVCALFENATTATKTATITTTAEVSRPNGFSLIQ